MVQTVFDFDRAARERDRALDAADAGADGRWKEDALDAALLTAKAHAELTADDVVRTLAGISTATTHDTRALGPVMRRAQAAGWIEPTDRIRSSERVSTHGSPRRIWRSLVWRST